MVSSSESSSIYSALRSPENLRAPFWRMEVTLGIMEAPGRVDVTWAVCLEEAGPWPPKRGSHLALALEG